MGSGSPPWSFRAPSGCTCTRSGYRDGVLPQETLGEARLLDDEGSLTGLRGGQVLNEL